MARAAQQYSKEELKALAKLALNPLAKYCPHKPTPRQRDFLALDHVYEVLYGGRAGGGKSVALLMAALKYVNEPGYNAIILRRTFADLAKPDAIMDLARQWLEGTDAKWNGQEHKWTFPSGATLSFGYLDGGKDHLSYKGAAFQFIGIDEMTEMVWKQVLYMHSRLRRPKTMAHVPLRFRGATNPGGESHEEVKERFGLDDYGNTANDNGRVFVPAGANDNEHLDVESYNKSLAELDGATRAQLQDGLWVQDPGDLVYHFNKTKNTIAKLPEADSSHPWKKLLAVDLGWDDATAFGVHYFREFDPMVYMVHSEKESELTVSAIYARIEELQAEFGPFEEMIADQGGGGKQVVETLRREYYLPLQAADKENKAGHIKLLNSDFESKEPRFVLLREGCEPLISELLKLRRKPGNKLEEHDQCPNHCSDTMLYGHRRIREQHMRVQAPRPSDKPAHGDPGEGEFLHQQRLAKLRAEARENDFEREVLYG